MKTLGIIGGGIVGKSLLFSLARKNGQKYDRVVIFESDDFAPACTARTTAMVASRGVQLGLSTLGDIIHQGITEFNAHVTEDSPRGVYPIYQISSALIKIPHFHRRYKSGVYFDNHYRDISFTRELPLFAEPAYFVAPDEYCSWLLERAQERLSIEEVREFVVSVDKDLNVKTLEGREFKFDHVVFAGSVNNKLWSSFTEDKKVMESKTVKGSYLHFKNIDWGRDSYSITMDELNVIYRAPTQEMLISATSAPSQNYFINDKELLRPVYDCFAAILNNKLPPFEQGAVITGLREKSVKREPYLVNEGNVSFLGGFYKNGFTLSLKMTKNLVDLLP